MATGSFFFILATGLLLGLHFPGVKSIGVCYGIVADNLPPPNEIVGLYLSNNIRAMRIYFTDHGALDALRGTNIAVILDVANSDISNIANDASSATGWVRDNIAPYSNVDIRYIAVGNEIIPTDIAQFILPAMGNIHNALNAVGLQDKIKVSTSVSDAVLGASYPPSAGAFTSDALNYLQPIIGFLSGTSAPLLANLYPYFSYIVNPSQIAIEYALFTSPGPVVTDGQLQYQNLFDAILDAFYSALEKVGGGGVGVVVSETGWPSAGGLAASPQNAQTYLSNLISHVKNGSPKRPGNIETYIFTMFDEDQKQSQGTENRYGLFYPNKQAKYNLNFS